jgi:hypothetical protein
MNVTPMKHSSDNLNRHQVVVRWSPEAGAFFATEKSGQERINA